MDKRADKQKADDPFSGGGGAVDDLTPPTMKYGPGGASQTPPSSSAAPLPTPTTSPSPSPNAGLDATIAGPGNMGGVGELTRLGATQIAPKTLAKTEITNNSGASPTVTGHQISTIPGGIPVQDLSSEKLLRDAPKVESSGRLCPALNGIPLWAKLGQGGMGAVYYGIHPRLRSEVAVKVLPFHLAAQDPSMIQRFYREAQIAAKVRSPHLVSVIDVNEESGLFFLVMEYVAGITMGQYIKQLKEKQISSGETIGMPELDVIDVMIAASKGLDAAHSNGIVHRDLKPENIMVPYKSRQNKNYDLKNAKLMDLGLARNEEGQQSLTGGQAAMGTPGYMAPEQALDAKTADKRSDIFGMGATIYALLSGRPPFQGDAVMKVLMATMHEPHEPIGSLRPDISAALAEVVDRSLDKRPENRYADAHDLIRALKNCRRLIAPEGEDEGDERDGVAGFSGTTKLNTTRTGTATANISAATRPLSGGYARAGEALSKNMTAVKVEPKKSMLPVILGVAAVFALVAGVGAYKYWPAPVVDPGRQGPEVSELLPASKLKLFNENLTQNLSKARNAILDGEADIADGNLEYALNDYQAKSKNLPKEIAEKAKKDIEEVKAAISEFRKNNQFASALKSISMKLADDQLKEAQDTAKALTPSNDEQKAALEKKFKEIEDKKALMATRDQVKKLLADAQKPGTPLPDAVAQVKSALTMMPESAEALDLLRGLETKQKQILADKEYADAISKTRSLWEKKEYANANLEIGKALMAKPNDKDAEELRNQIQAKLSAAELEAQAKQERLSRQEKLNATFTSAEQHFKNNKGTEALAEIDEALKIAALLKDEAADGYLKPLKAKIVVLVQKQADEALAMKKKRDYEDLLTKAKGLLKADDTNGFASALEYTDKAAALYSSGPEAQEAASVKSQIEARKLAWDNLKLHNTAVSSARQLLLSVKDDKDSIDSSLKTVESAAKKIDEALAIVTGGKIAVDQLKDPKVAEKLKADIVAKKAAIEAIVAKQAQYKSDYATAIKTGDDLFKQSNFFGALTAFEKGKEASIALGYEQKTELELKINKAKSKLEQVNALFASVDALLKEDRFDDAMAKLTDGEKTMVDSRFETMKADVKKSMAALDGQVKTAMDSAGAMVKDGKFADAMTMMATETNKHKARKDLAQTYAALKKIQDVVDGGAKDAAGLEARFANISGALGARLGLSQKDFKKFIAELKALDKTAAERLATAGIAAADTEANALASVRSTLVSKANKEYDVMERAVNISSTPIQNPNVERPPTTGDGGKERTGEK